MSFPKLSPEEAVADICHGDTISFSGFSPAGGAKAVPLALAARARKKHEQEKPFKVRVLTGASSGRCIDEDLARAEAVSWRAPYQSGDTLRRQINRQEVEYVDHHLSHVPQMVTEGFFGGIRMAVVEATEITSDGRIYLTTSIGASPTYLRHADHVVIEINQGQSQRLREFADIYTMPLPPHRTPIPIYEPLNRIGVPYATVDPRKVIGIVETNEPDAVPDFSGSDEISRGIAENVVEFLLNEMRAGRIPPTLLPLQAGAGNVANSVMAALGANPDIPGFCMYSEVCQNAMIDLMIQNKIRGISACSLTVTAAKLREIVDNMDFFASRIVLRPQEISNHPGVIRRLGVIALNTALELDIYGNVNSSHICGTHIVNGIGGSGEFTRNSYLSIFMTPSTAKGGKVSAVVPMCPHIDNNEHSVQIVVTEQGLADLRGLGPLRRAKTIIDNCAHPRYRDYLHQYIREAPLGHIPHDLTRCFEMHRNFMQYGDMLPEG
ncbi:MAG: succinate CoA transferase [Desulfobacteraceae bacterium]|nr:succinate CoA transferase [Desulfobacteraceae bacterium]